MKYVIGIIAIILIVWGLATWNSNDASPVSNDPIKIGAILPFTGVGAYWAETAKNAADLAKDEINNDGGVDGRMVEIIYEDSQTDPATGVSAFKKLAEIDKVDVLVGDVWAFLTNPLIPLAEASKKILISPTVMNASVEGSSDYFFTLGHMTESLRPAVEKFFDVNSSVKNIGIICSNDPWGTAITKVYEEVANEKGKVIIEKTCTVGFTPDYRAEATKIKGAKPDAVLLVGIADRAVKVLRELNVTVPILTDSNLIDGFENRGGVTLEQLENTFTMDWHAERDFIEKYMKAYNHYPIVEAQNAYETIRSIAKGFENNPNNLLEGLKMVKYDSVDGVIDFTSGDHININKAEAKLYKIIGKGNYQEVK